MLHATKKAIVLGVSVALRVVATLSGLSVVAQREDRPPGVAIALVHETAD